MQRRKEKTLVRLKPSIRSTPSVLDASEFNWPSLSKEGILENDLQDDKNAVSELVGALKDVSATSVQKKLGVLKKHLSTTYQHHPKSLKTPLPDRERDRLERNAAYQQASTEISDWDEIVKRNRLAEKLVFPLYSQPLRVCTAEKKIQQFEPRTKLEIETAKLLATSKHNLRNSDPLTEAEKETLKSMSLDEAKERRSRLQKTRALVSYAERKIRWKNKIKSKRYRRLLKKQERRKAEKEFQELLEKDPAAAMDKLEMLDRDRIKERASLKHRATGKWSKQIRHMAKKDPRLREALQEQLRKGRELAEKKRVEVNVEDDGDEEEGDASGEEEDNVGGQGKTANEKLISTQPMLAVRPRLVTNLDEEMGGQETNQDLMAEAFADDDLMEEFRAELSAEIDREDQDAVDNLEAQLGLPGWNSWTGPGTEKLKSNRDRRERLTVLKKKHDDEKRLKLKKYGSVKINESANESIKKLQVSDLPFPFKSAKDFEANLEPPLGKEWNPQTAHQLLVQPEVVTRMGTVIKPISREVALRKKMETKDKRRMRGRKRKPKEDDKNKMEVESETVES